MIHRLRGFDPLGDIAPGIMHLQEKPSRVPFLRGEPPVPDVGDKQSHVTCFGNQGLHFDAIPTQLIVIVSILSF